MAKADQFGLWPQSAATLDASLCMQNQELPAFLELESAIPAELRQKARGWLAKPAVNRIREDPDSE
jgi:hypothetical protein